MNIGEFELQGEFIDSLGNQSDLDDAQVRRARRGGLIGSTGSSQLSWSNIFGTMPARVLGVQTRLKKHQACRNFKIGSQYLPL